VGLICILGVEFRPRHSSSHRDAAEFSRRYRRKEPRPAQSNWPVTDRHDGLNLGTV